MTDGMTPLVGNPDATVGERRAEGAAGFAAEDAGAASAEAGEALYEAQFGSVSIDRLLAGSLQVGQYIQSTSYSAGSSGWRINANGSAEFNNVTVRGTIVGSEISGSDIFGGSILSSGGIGLGDSGNLGWGSAWFEFDPGTGRVNLNGVGLDVDGDSVALSGWRETDGIDWLGAAYGTNGNTGSSDGSGGFHTHAVPYHTHEVTI